MGIHLTRYGDGVGGGEIVFDVDCFDYTYDSDSFPTDSQNDFGDILLEHGSTYSFYRESDTVDSLGHISDISQTTYDIYGKFMDITMKDRKIHEMGLAVPGNRKFYFRHSYTNTVGGVADTYELKEGDIILDDEQYSGTGRGQWRVVKILKQWWQSGTEVYRIAIVQNINLDGTA